MKFQIIKTHLKNKIFNLIGKTSLSRIQLNRWLKSVDIKTDKVLEVGPSFNPVINKVRSWKVNRYKTLDNNLEADCNPNFSLDLNHIRFSDKYGWIGKRKKDNRVIKEVFKFSPNIIFCLEVMEYIYKPNEVLAFFHDFLSKDGTLYISFHSIYPVHEPYKYDSLRYTKWGVINLLKDSGFSKWEIEPRTVTVGKSELLSFYKKEKMRALKNSDLIIETGYLVKAEK